MRTLSFLFVLAALSLLFAAPASADYRDNGRRDYYGYGYIEDKLDEWVDYAEDFGFEIITAETGEIRSTENLWFSLEPGDYHAYAEGGQNIDDLDMVVYDNRGYELASDYLTDNYPIAEFSINNRQDVEFELSVFSSGRYDDRGEFCFVLARERDYRDDNRGWDSNRDNRGRDRNRDDRGRNDRNNRDDNNRDRGNRGNYRDDRSGWSNDWQNWWSDYDNGRDRNRSDRSNSDRRGIIEDKLDYLYDFAWDRGMNPVMDDIGEINDVRTYSLTLHEGYYVVFAAGGPLIDDLDLHVSWRDGWDVAEDIGIDAAPAVWFYVPSRTTIDIEVEVFGFSGNNFEDYFCLLVCED